MKTNPITPPRELVREWYGSEDCPDEANALANYLCTQAARWGADQELEACCKWLPKLPPWSANDLRKHRRPKPPSLKEQALDELIAAERLYPADWSTIRRALEALDD